MSPVSVIGGSGELGFGLALRLGHAGVPVVVGSRDAERARATAQTLAERAPGGDFRGDVNGAACEGADIVVLAVPYRHHQATLAAMRVHMTPGQVLVDATVPLASAVGGRPVHALGVWQGSAAQQAAGLVPEGVGVVSALHTVAASQLRDLDQAFAQDVLLCGDSREDKRRVAELIGRIDGMRCVDCGALEMSRYVEQLTPLLIGLNLRYKAKSGIRVVGLPDDPWR